MVILERGTELYDLPRAVGLDSDSMRAFQRLGMSEAVQAILQPARPGEELQFTNSKREKLFGMSFPPIGVNGTRDLAFFDQPELEGVIRATLEQRGDVTIRDGFEVERIEQDETGVSATGRGPDGEATYRGAYLIGCDGASSFARRSIDSKWESLGYDQDWLVVDVTIHPEAELTENMMQVCDPERLTTYVPVRDPNRRWEFQLIDGDLREEMASRESVEKLLDPWLPPEHYDLRRAVVYQFHAATASAWRDRRILLAGDAAHQTPPFLGQGLNSGFRDGVCLGWKLPLVLSGACDPALLDSYQDERGAHARDLVDRAVGIGQLMETLAAREAGLPDPHASAETRAAPPNGQIIPPIRGGTLLDAQIADDAPTGRPFFQPHVRRAGGPTTMLDEHLGKGFVVVGRTPADLEVGPEADAVLERLGARRVALEGFEVMEGIADPLLETSPAAIVRPDRIVFGVVDADHDLDALVATLAEKLALKV